MPLRIVRQEVLGPSNGHHFYFLKPFCKDLVCFNVKILLRRYSIYSENEKTLREAQKQRQVINVPVLDGRITFEPRSRATTFLTLLIEYDKDRGLQLRVKDDNNSMRVFVI